MSKEIFVKICDVLDSKSVAFEHLTHEHVHTSEDAAKIRGNTIDQAAKAIVIRAKNRDGKHEFIQCVLPGSRKIKMKILKKLIDARSVSLATPEEVLEVTDCMIGSVPPFGPLLGLKTLVDRNVLSNEFIYFSAGTHYDSIKMKASDFAELFDFVIEDFSF